MAVATKYVTPVTRKIKELGSVNKLIQQTIMLMASAEKYQRSSAAKQLTVTILEGNLIDRYAVAKGLLVQAGVELALVSRWYPIRIEAGKPDDPATSTPILIDKDTTLDDLSTDEDSAALSTTFFNTNDVVLLEGFTDDDGEHEVDAVTASTIQLNSALVTEDNHATGSVTLIRRENP